MMSGDEALKGCPAERFICSSNFFIPGNGKSFASLYLCICSVEGGGTGDTAPGELGNSVANTSAVGN